MNLEQHADELTRIRSARGASAFDDVSNLLSAVNSAERSDVLLMEPMGLDAPETDAAVVSASTL